jgi:translocation and assembly module TamB
VQARSARLVSTSLTTMTADMDARMNGALLQSPLISGTVDIRRWDIRIPERLARSLRPIKVTHRNVPPGLVTDDDLTEPEWGSALPFRLDVAVRAPREVFVRGQGVDAEFGGAANLGGTVDAPVVRGAFDLRRGAVTLLSQRIILSRGDIQFVGDTQPMLDIAGSVSKNGVAATISVKGRAGDPQIVLSSAPSLPQDEILSRLLFSKRTTQLSPFEAAQLAQLIGRWSGLDTGPDILERLRTAIGLDALTATTDEAGTTSVSAGSYVGRGVYIGASEAAGGSATVDVDITENIKLRGEAGTAGTKVGVAAEWEY